MSLSDSNANVRTFPVITAASSDIPQSCLSSSAPRPIQSRIGLKQVLSQTGSQTSNGTLLFPLGCGAGQGFLKAGSVYLAGSITVTQGGAEDWGFNQSGGADALILRSTVYVNGAIAEQTQFYNRINMALEQHCGNSGYVRNDLAIMSLKGITALARNVAVPFVVPFKSGVMNAQHDLPLFLMNTCQVELNLDSVAAAILSRTTGATEYTINNARLIYEVFYPEVDYENSMRAVLASGKLWQSPVKSWYNLVVTNTGTTKSQPIGLNMSSVLGFFHFSQTDAGTVLLPHYPTGDTPAGQGTRVFCDGNLINNYAIVDTPVIFAEKSRAMGLLLDPERSSIGVAGAAAASVDLALKPADLNSVTYLANSFLAGVSLIKTQESGFSMAGTAVSQAVVEVTNAGTIGQLYIFVAYEQIMTLDAMGSLQMIR
jgi:hypothetical protein